MWGIKAFHLPEHRAKETIGLYSEGKVDFLVEFTTLLYFTLLYFKWENSFWKAKKDLIWVYWGPLSPTFDGGSLFVLLLELYSEEEFFLWMECQHTVLPLRNGHMSLPSRFPSKTSFHLITSDGTSLHGTLTNLGTLKLVFEQIYIGPKSFSLVMWVEHARLMISSLIVAIIDRRIGKSVFVRFSSLENSFEVMSNNEWRER